MTLDEVVGVAASEGWRIRPPTLTPIPILLGDDVVGFYCPHPAGRGRMRVGPIYVLPTHRGQRLAEQAYERMTGPIVAYVHDGNTASERLHERCGFAIWYRTKGGSYWRRG